MTPTPEQTAALAEALRNAFPLVPGPAPSFVAIDDAAAILAALDGWTLVPTAELERLRNLETALRIIAMARESAPGAIPVSARNVARAALAGDAT